MFRQAKESFMEEGEEGFAVVDKPVKLRRSLSWSSFDEPSPSSRNIEKILMQGIPYSARLYSHYPTRILTRPCEIVVCMPTQQPEGSTDHDSMPISRWYRLQVPTFLPLKPVEIFPFWKGFVPVASSVAVLGSEIYYVGGVYDGYYIPRSIIPDVLKLDLTSSTPNLVPANNYMISSRREPIILVHDQKLFAIGGFCSIASSAATAIATAGPLFEMYEPKTNAQGRFFGLVQSAPELQIVIIDAPIFRSSFVISVVGVLRYKTEDPTEISCCFSLDTSSSSAISATDITK